ncbi:MAG: DUF58 domain-containing protein [Gemmatimonadetes bacterium]|nr:DUF58 domain-containing protein [Gemmatimonadota bacterium]
MPSRRLAGLIALAGAAFILSTPLALALNALLLALIAADAIALYRLPVPQLERIVPPRLPLGGAVEVPVELRNTAPVSRRVLWTDDPGPGIRHGDSDVMDTTIAAGGEVRLAATVHAEERGTTYLGDLHMRVLSPLGLLWRRVRERRNDRVTVQPGLRELRRHRLLALHHRIAPGPRRVREVGEGREFERLREYVRGDDPRRIDWKATARRGEPIVRQYEAERSQSIVLALDAGRLMSERFEGRERLDHSLAAALVLADAAAVHGDGVGVLLFADTVQAYLPPARYPLARIADVLATVETRRVEPDYPGAFRFLARRLRRRSLVVLFTDIIDARASAALLEHLGASARRHLPMIVAMRNVELEAAAGAAVRDERGAFQRAAAEELMQARAIALNAIRRRGVLVTDVRPEAATTETLARYLEIKRRGLL